MNAVEIGSNHCYEKNYSYLLDYKFEYIIHNYFPIPKKSFVVNIASFNDEIRDMSIKHIKGAIDFCKKINAKLYTFHPGFITDPKGSNLTEGNYDFLWDDTRLNYKNNSIVKSLMYNSLDKIIDYVSLKDVRIAIETEGSLSKKNHLLMQQPVEYEQLMARYSSSDIGVNLNIGHLNLASKAFGFSRSKFIDLIDNYIVAMELSHNNRIEDQHLPLRPNEWYWNTIFDSRFDKVFQILEFRNTSIKIIKDNIKLFNDKKDEFQAPK